MIFDIAPVKDELGNDEVIDDSKQASSLGLGIVPFNSHGAQVQTGNNPVKNFIPDGSQDLNDVLQKNTSLGNSLNN